MKESTLVFLLAAAFLFSSCNKAVDSVNNSGSGDLGSSAPEEPLNCTPLESSQDEPEYCGTSSNLSGQLLSGSATFQARKPNSSGLGAAGSPEAIRYAEVHVYDSDGNRVQCGETDGSGQFQFRLPATAGTYEVRVLSRANNNFVHTSVLQDPNDNQPHYISKTVSSNGSSSSLSAGTLLAPATGSLEGGAFNIYDQIVQSNQFLRDHTTGCAADGCVEISVAEKSKIYWSKGVTPTTFFGQSGPLSFFSPCDNALFILGGLNGNTDTVDTDHFDNSIIIHEYGHFLEDTYAGTDTPGGAHDGNSIIDPRLAWGEGFANFLQAAVTGNPEYIDTEGNVSGSTQFIFKENIEVPEHDIPLLVGEGNFREFSISRALWDLIDPHPVSGQGTNEGNNVDNITLSFSSLWTVFTSDFKQPSTHFRNYGLFMEKLVALEPTADIFSVLSGEKQRASQIDYATPMEKGTCTSTTTIVGRTNPGNPNLSDLFASNDFIQYEHPGGTLNVELVYESINTSDPTDLDLYVYYEDHVIGASSSDMLVGASQDYAADDNGTEQVTKSVDAGVYMIIVNVAEDFSVPLGSGAVYHLNVDGERLCP